MGIFYVGYPTAMVMWSGPGPPNIVGKQSDNHNGWIGRKGSPSSWLVSSDVDDVVLLHKVYLDVPDRKLGSKVIGSVGYNPNISHL